ncbi:APC family permease [Leuconostoc falkenbergense]|uniref:APC family permease n=1 Tax=Leuconostoc falkenbergense TaxID=2766470 RepID=UPI001967F24A|nr:APC family permease [Leuconostoc falkenbergense]QSB52010.1 APC family permease [Leuconostoc falkenbergense]
MEQKNNSLKRTLTVKDLVIYGIIFMIPVAPMAYYGSFLAPAHGMVGLAYLIGMVAMLFTGFSYAIMSGKFPYAGSVYTYVQKGASAPLGFIAGWGITLDYILLPTVCMLVSASFGTSLFPNIPNYVWIIGLVIINTVINMIGVDFVSKVSWILFGLQLFVLIAFIVGAIKLLFDGTIEVSTVSLYNPKEFHISGVLSSTSLVIVSYLGFDAISTLAEETSDPQRSVGKAVILSILLVGTLFVITALFAGFVVPNYASLNPDTAFITILDKVGGAWLTQLVQWTMIVSFGLASGQECQTAISRILFAMGRDGILPKALGQLKPKYRTPWTAIILVSIVSSILSLLLDLTTVGNLVSFGALFGFMCLNGAVIWKFYIKDFTFSVVKFIKYLISPLIGFGVSLWIFVSLDMASKFTGIAWLIIGLGILLYQTKFFKLATPQFDFGEKH